MSQKIADLIFVLPGPEPPRDVCARFTIVCPSCKEGRIQIGGTHRFVIGQENPGKGILVYENLEMAWRSQREDLADPLLFSCPECGVYFRITQATFAQVRESAERWFARKEEIARA